MKQFKIKINLLQSPEQLTVMHSSIYTKLDETLCHNTSLGVTMSPTCPTVPFTCVQLSQQSANTSESDRQL